MSKESSAFTKFLYQRLQNIFNDYLKDFTIEAMQLGKMQIDNIEFREDLLLLKDLPLIIQRGKIGRIAVQTPILNFRGNPIKVDIENVEIHIRLLVEQRNIFKADKMREFIVTESAKAKLFETIENFKKKKLKNWEDQARKYFQELAPPGWIRKRIDVIINNMIVHVKNFNLYYESSSVMDSPAVMKISFQDLTLHPTDADGKALYNNELKAATRCIRIFKLSVAINFSSKLYNQQNRPRSANQNMGDRSELSPSEVNFGTRTQLTNKSDLADPNDEEEYSRIRDNDSYFMLPLDLTILVGNKNDPKDDYLQKSKKFINIELNEPLILLANKIIMKYLTSLSQNFKVMQIVQKNLHLRPLDIPKNNEKVWWKYAISAVIEDLQRKNAIGLNSLWKRDNKRKYIDLWKRKQTIVHVPWLPGINEREEYQLRALEETLSLHYLLEFREWAMIEIRVEAKRFFSSNKDFQGLKPLLDIWSNALNNDMAFMRANHKKHGTSAANIRLSREERMNLYEILELDKAKVLESFLKGEHNEPHEIVNEFSFKLHSVYVLVSELKGSEKSQNISRALFKLNQFKLDSEVTEQVRTIKDEYRNKFETNVKILNDSPRNLEENPEEDFQSAIGNHQMDNSANMVSSNIILPNPSNKQDQEDPFDMSQSGSFHEHMRNLVDVDDKYNNYNNKEEPKPKFRRYKSSMHETQSNTYDWWNQKLLLLVEILGISARIRKYRNGKLRTVDESTVKDKEKEKDKIKDKDKEKGKESPFTIRSIMISTALNLFKAFEEKSRLNKDHYVSALKYNELVVNIMNYDFKFVGQEKNPMIKFLEDCDCKNYADFISLFQRDRPPSRNKLRIAQKDDYFPFFDYDNEEMFLGVEARLVKNVLRQHISNSLVGEAEEITKVRNHLINHINHNILPTFLLYYGMLVLPFMIAQRDYTEHTEADAEAVMRNFAGAGHHFLSKLPTIAFGRMKPSAAKLPKDGIQHDFMLQFETYGKTSDFSIKRIEDFTKNEKKKYYNPSGLVQIDKIFNWKTQERVFSEEKKENKPSKDEESEHQRVVLRMRPLLIFLSSESLLPLVSFLATTAAQLSPEGKKLVAADEPTYPHPIGHPKYRKRGPPKRGSLSHLNSPDPIERGGNKDIFLFPQSSDERAKLKNISPFSRRILTTEMIEEIIEHPQDTQPKRKSSISVEELEELLAVIKQKRAKSQNEEPKKLKPPLYTIQLDGFKLIYTDSMGLLVKKRTLELQIDSVFLRVNQKDDFGPINAHNPEKLMKDNYNLSTFIVNSIKLTENNKSIFETRVIIHKWACKDPNHPSLTNNKLNILIPYITVTFSDDMLLFMEVLTIIKRYDAFMANQRVHSEYLYHKKTAFMASNNQIIELQYALNILKSDHTNPRIKSCRHCILRFKKSKTLLNVFVGDLASISKSSPQTIFRDLIEAQTVAMQADLVSQATQSGPLAGITIYIENQIKKNDSHLGKLRIQLPFVCFTKDKGYFKENMALHATKAIVTACEDEEPFSVGKPKTLKEQKKEENHSHKISEIEILPILEADQDLFAQLDNSFWKYFRSQEKKNFEDPRNDKSLEIASRSMPSNRSDQTPEDYEYQGQEKVYLVMLRKKNNHKDLLKDFEAEPMRKDYSLDKLLFSLGVISFSFYKPENLTSIFTVIDTLVYLTKWFEQYHQQVGIHEGIVLPDVHMESFEHIAEEVKRKKFDFGKLIRSEYFLLQIGKIQLQVEKNDFLKVCVNKLVMENLQFERDAQGNIKSRLLESSEPVRLLSIQNFIFTTHNLAEGHVDGIGLEYDQSGNCLTLFVRNFSYEMAKRKPSPSSAAKRRGSAIGNFSIDLAPFEQAPRTMIHIPDLGPENNNKKNLEYLENKGIIGFQISFVLSETTKRIAEIAAQSDEINFSISSDDVSQMFSTFAILSSILIDERKHTLSILEKGLFHQDIFLEISNLLKMNQEEEENKGKIYVESLKDVGSAEGSENDNTINQISEILREAKDRRKLSGPETHLKFTAIIKGLTMNFAKNKEIFASYVLRRVELNELCHKDYKIKIDGMSFRTGSKQYPDIILPSYNTKIVVRLIDKKPLVRIKNARIIYIAKFIKELSLFQKEVVEKLKASQGSLKKHTQENMLSETNKLEHKDKNILWLELKNCQVFVPRTSQHQDNIFAYVNKGGVIISNTMLDVHFPKLLEVRSYKLVGKEATSIVEMNPKLDAMPQSLPFTVANVTLEGVRALYAIDERISDLANVNEIKIKAFLPSHPPPHNNWEHDGKQEISLSDFNLLANLGTLDEIKELLDANLKEPSKIYDLKSKGLSRINMSIKHGTINFGMTKFIVTRDRVASLPKPLEKPTNNPNEEDNRSFVGYLDNLTRLTMRNEAILDDDFQ